MQMADGSDWHSLVRSAPVHFSFVQFLSICIRTYIVSTLKLFQVIILLCCALDMSRSLLILSVCLSVCRERQRTQVTLLHKQL